MSAMAASRIQMREAAAEDRLTVSEAKERIEWAYRCGQYGLGDFAEEAEDEYLDALFTRSHQERARPRYPVFTNNHFTQVWIAPTDRNASCTIPSGFSFTIKAISG